MENEMQKDLDASILQLEKLTGKDICAMRLPFGEEDERVLQFLFENGIVPIGFSIDSQDHTGIPSETIAENMLQKLSAGDIILFRNNCGNTAEAIDLILTEMDKRHYKAVSIKKILFE